MADQFITELNSGTVATGLSLTDLLAVEQGVGVTPITMPTEFQLLINKLLQGRYKISPSVASNNLTVAIQDLAGNNPSASNVIPFRVGDTLYNLATTTSFTKNAGTNWCNLGSAELAAQPTDLFVYAIAETGAAAGLKFGFSRIPYALTTNDFVNTTTNEKYIAGNWTNFATTYAVANIGRFRAQLSAGAGYNWSIAAQVVVNRPIYDSDWLAWTPTYAGYSANPTSVDTYKIESDRCWVNHAVTAPGTSNATTATLTFPFMAGVSSQIMKWIGILDNGVLGSSGHLECTAGSATISAFKGFYQTPAWTNSGAKAQYWEAFSFPLR